MREDITLHTAICPDVSSARLLDTPGKVSGGHIGESHMSAICLTGETSSEHTTPSVCARTGFIPAVCARTGFIPAVCARIGFILDVCAGIGFIPAVCARIGFSPAVCARIGFILDVCARTGFIPAVCARGTGYSGYTTLSV